MAALNCSHEVWWRIFVPSWRFFDVIGAEPQLWVCHQGHWQLALHRPPLLWSSLFLNGPWTYYHACHNLLERLVQELQLGHAPETLVSFQLVQHLVNGEEFKLQVQNEVILHVPARVEK